MEHKVTGARFARRVLVVFDQAPRVIPPALFHATPSHLVDSILAEGQKPSRLTEISTTNFPDAHLWIHLFEAIDHAESRWLLVPESRTKIPSGPYTVLRVQPQGVTNLLCDPCTVHGYVTAEVIPPAHLSIEPRPPIIVP
jgi:hypothetical protein